MREHGATQPNAHIEFHDDIAIFNAGAGISLSGCNGYQVEQNYITAGQQLLGTMNYAGITLWNSHNNFLGCNSVDGDYESNAIGDSFGPFGIRARASTNVDYDCNDVQDTYLGVQFDMPCGNTDFHTTSFLNHRYGLHYTATGNTGLQPAFPTDPLHGNRWNGTWDTPIAVGARHESSNQNYVNASQYIVSSLPSPLGPENPESVSNTWFLEKMRQELSCGITCNAWVQNHSPTSSLDEKVARGQLNPGVYDASMQWLMQQQLYRRLHDAPSLIQSGSVLDSFYNANAGTTIGQFVQVEDAARGLFGLDSATVTQLENYRQQLVSRMGSVITLDSLLQSATGQDSLDLLAQRLGNLQVIDSLSQLNSTLVDSVLQTRSQQANPVIAQNNALTVTDIWEVNEKTVNHIFLNTLAKGIPVNNTQLGLLRNIAGQCPYEGGTAVFDARALLDGLTNDVFDDELLCTPGGQQELILPPVGNTTSLPGIQIYPNPTDKELTVKFANATDEELEIRLTNLYGQALSTYHIPEQTVSYSLQLPEMPNGIYWLIIYSGDGQKEVKRVVITR